jgi:hypothetical protein
LFDRRHGGTAARVSDGLGECFKGDPDAGIAGLVGGDFVVAAAKVLNKGRDRKRQSAPIDLVAVPRIGRSRALSRAWSLAMGLFAYRSIMCSAAGSRSSSTRG